MLQIDINPDHIIFEGQRINKPSRISISEWLDFWELVKRQIKNERV
jgi:hypothetical protein